MSSKQVDFEEPLDNTEVKLCVIMLALRITALSSLNITILN